MQRKQQTGPLHRPPKPPDPSPATNTAEKSADIPEKQRVRARVLALRDGVGTSRRWRLLAQRVAECVLPPSGFRPNARERARWRTSTGGLTPHSRSARKATLVVLNGFRETALKRWPKMSAAVTPVIKGIAGLRVRLCARRPWVAPALHPRKPVRGLRWLLDCAASGMAAVAGGAASAGKAVAAAAAATKAAISVATSAAIGATERVALWISRTTATVEAGLRRRVNAWRCAASVETQARTRVVYLWDGSVLTASADTNLVDLKVEIAARLGVCTDDIRVMIASPYLARVYLVGPGRGGGTQGQGKRRRTATSGAGCADGDAQPAGDGTDEPESQTGTAPGNTRVRCSGCNGESSIDQWRSRCRTQCMRGATPVMVCEHGEPARYSWHRCGRNGSTVLQFRNGACAFCGRRESAGDGEEGRRVSGDAGAGRAPPPARRASAAHAADARPLRQRDTSGRDATQEGEGPDDAERRTRGERSGGDGAAAVPAAESEHAGERGSGAADHTTSRAATHGAVGDDTGGGRVDARPFRLPHDAARALYRTDGAEARATHEPLNLVISRAEYVRVMRMPQPPVKWIPRASRSAALNTTVRALYDVAEFGTPEASRALHALPRLWLYRREGVAQRIAAVERGGQAARRVVEELLAAPAHTRRTGGEASREYRDPIERAVQMAREGRPVEAIRVLAQAELEEVLVTEPPLLQQPAPTETRRQLLERLLPTVRDPVDPETIAGLRSARPVQGQAVSYLAMVTGVNWKRELRMLRVGTAGGPDAWRPEMVLSLYAANEGAAASLAAAFRAYAVAFVRLRGEARQIELAARMTFIPKKDGGLRPIGVTNLFRRILGRGVVKAVLGKKGPLLRWMVARGQFGAGAPAGTEGLAAFTQRCVDGGGAALAIDRSNAYGLSNPAVVVAWTQGSLPVVHEFSETITGVAEVYADLEDDILDPYLWSGLFHGCSASPMFYAGPVEALIDPVRPQLRNLRVKSAGFLDDGGLAAPREHIGNLAEALRLVERATARGGQRLNAAKCFAVCSPENVDAVVAALGPGTRVVTGAVVVGVPVGTAEYVADKAAAIVTAARTARQRLAGRLPVQAAFFTLRISDGWAKVQHVFRAVCPDQAERAARIHDEATRGELASMLGPGAEASFAASRPLTLASALPLRLGGHAISNARTLGPIAFAAAAVQTRRLLDAAFPRTAAEPAAQPHSSETSSTIEPALFHPRESGRPAHSEFAGVAGGEAVLCRGKGKCRMPADETCARHMCATCCVLTHPDGAGPGCLACAGVATRARESLERECPGLFVSVAPALLRTATRTGAPPLAVQDAFLISAVRFDAPQRAITCAINGFVRDALSARMSRTERFTLDSCSDKAAYAPLLAVPVGAFKLRDDVFRLMLRRRMGLPILAPTSTRCVTVSWKEPKTCSLNGAAGGNADSHAECCKNGGWGIGAHNRMRSCLGGWCRMAGNPTDEESKNFLPPESNMKVDTMHLTAGGAYCKPLAVDLTGRYGADRAGLCAAELAKENKYQPHFVIPVTMRGFAYNNLCAFGPGAHEVVDRVVSEAARGGAGHPEDLALELYVMLGNCFWRAMTARYAWFAMINGDRSLTAPIAPRGRNRVTGPSVQLRGGNPPVSRLRKRRAEADTAGVRGAAPASAPAPADARVAFASAAGGDAAAGRDTVDGTNAAGVANAAAAAPAACNRGDPRDAAAAVSRREGESVGAGAAAAASAGQMIPFQRQARGVEHSALFCPILAGALGIPDPAIEAIRRLAPDSFEAARAALPQAWAQEGITADDVRATREEFERRRCYVGAETQERYVWPFRPGADSLMIGPRLQAAIAVNALLTAWYANRETARPQAAQEAPAEVHADARAGAHASRPMTNDATGGTAADEVMDCS